MWYVGSNHRRRQCVTRAVASLDDLGASLHCPGVLLRLLYLQLPVYSGLVIRLVLRILLLLGVQPQPQYVSCVRCSLLLAN